MPKPPAPRVADLMEATTSAQYHATRVAELQARLDERHSDPLSANNRARVVNMLIDHKARLSRAVRQLSQAVTDDPIHQEELYREYSSTYLKNTGTGAESD